jgi:sugar O-acyltransferase (sialic acid O-acetyltransferase NeuD family)
MTAGPDVRPLAIVGAGGLGRETLAAVRAVNAVEPTWTPIGFFDDKLETQGTVLDGLPVVGPISALEELLRNGMRAQCIVCTGRPGATASRAVLAERVQDAGGTFATVVHPGASLAIGTTVGAGSILFAGVVTTTPLHLGRLVVAMPNVVFTHDDEIGDVTTFGANVSLSGGVRVEEGAYVGAGAAVRENLTVGSNSLVGMGSVVTHDVPADEVWVGNPARCFMTATRLPSRVPA